MQSSFQDVVELEEWFRKSIKTKIKSEEYFPVEVPILDTLHNKIIVGSVKITELQRFLKLKINRVSGADSLQQVRESIIKFYIFFY